MLSILQHPDVQRCFADPAIQDAMDSKSQHSIQTLLRGQDSVQQLLTNTTLVQRISTMHLKMRRESENESESESENANENANGIGSV